MQTKYPFYEIEYELHTVSDVVALVLKTYGDNPVFRYKRGKEICEKGKDVFVADVQQIGNLFHTKFARGSHIALLGKTSYEWIACYFAAMNSENIVVPLDKELPEQDILELVDFADTDCLIYDADYQDVASYILEHTKQTPFLICMQSIEQGENLWDMVHRTDNTAQWSGNPLKDDVAEIIFTSGTTGKSKGCMLTHENLAWNAMSGKSVVAMSPEDSVMSILPINHALEMAAGIMTQFCSGVTICINDSLKYMAKNLLLYRPSGMVVVPLVMETLYKNIWREIDKQNKTKKVKLAMKMIWLLYKCHIDIRRKMFAEILARLGGNLRVLVVGGAYLDPELIKAYETWGITIVQGYGITECAPVIACNIDRCRKYESVGKIVTGCEVRIVENEIWARGPIVMKGYYKNPHATAEVFEGEWFKTGDLGYTDAKGFLYISGRKKNLIILPNGENVSPEELEQKILRFPYVKEVVVSEKNGQIQAEIFPDREKEPNAEKRISDDIMELNKTLPNYKKIGRTLVRDQEFEKTTTQKIKRNQHN